MLNYLINKFLLVREIVSKKGLVHFRRYRLFSSPWFRIFIHQISRADEDAHMHDHPYHFISLILKGSYYERWRLGPRYGFTLNAVHEPGSIIKHHRSDIHQIESIERGPVWTLVFAYGKYQEWGYRLKNPEDENRFTRWVDHKTYRRMKNNR